MKLKIKFPNGDTFLVPVEVVAEQRTKYYSELDGFEKGSKEWEDEFKQSMREDEILDWVQNNMDWEDVEKSATKVDNGDWDYGDMWFDSEFEIEK